MTPPIHTTATPGGSTVPLGDANQFDAATISAAGGHPAPTGTMTFFLCNPSQVTSGGCVSGGTQVGNPVQISSGSASSDKASGSLLATVGKYCWRAAYAPDADGSKFYNAGSHTDATDECFTVVKSSPKIVTTPDPKSVTLGTSSVTLKDSAVLSGGSSPTGSITFTLVYNGSTVDTETVSVSGNNTYTTPTGYTLPTSGTVTGTYQWNATYSGDGNNNTVSENNDASEQVTVNKAGPSLVTTASPHGTVTLDGGGSPTLTDSALLSGGYHPTGSITFTLKYNGSTVDTETVTVSGNGAYSTPTGYTLPSSGTVTGSYVWTATYGGDGNNTSASDPGTSALEQLTVNKAGPSLVTTASPHGTVTLDGGGSPTLTDSALLSGGYHPTGSITFTLKYNGSTVDTETVTVSGNGAYSTPTGYTLPSSGTVTGSYVWTATYGGDGNNTSASDPGTSALEQLTVNKAGPSLVTTASPHGTVTLDGGGSPTLTDSALLSGGYHPTGSITFTLKYNGSTVDTETVTVSGNGAYSTPTGYTLPSSGTVTGSYVWTATYGGDGNNTSASDPGTSALEQVTVNPASPELVTTADPHGTVTLDDADSPVLNDSADLSGGYNPTGSITFTLSYNGTPVYTDNVTVGSGNGTYTTAAGDNPGGYTLPADGSTVTGSYVWTATYHGDGNNDSASDPGTSALEKATVNPASPDLVTTADPHGTVTLDDGASPTLNDSAALSGGYNPGGLITFTLSYKGTPVYTDNVTVDSGNGTYTTAAGDNPGGYTLPTSGTVTGSYVWTATYGGDGNNDSASDPGTSALEQVTVNPASPDLVTTADPHGTVTLDDAGSPILNDSAVLSSGYHPTGTITFTLSYNGTPVYTDNVTVDSGNGTYTTAAGDAPGGYTLPTSSTVTGSYVWTATYKGDGNNDTASDPGTSGLEQVTVNPASPTIVTTPDPKSVTVSGSTTTLNDSAVLSGGYNPTGTITFTLVYNGVTVDTETATVTGNGTYSTPTGYTLPSSGKVTGTYQWNATYNGDGNNNAVSENDDASEQVTVNPAEPSITTVPSELAGSVNDLLNDTATLSGGHQFDGSGTITFNLYGPGAPTCGGTPAYTETVTADHNGDYTTSNTTILADTAGIWNWTATFSGDGNNTQALSGCGEEEVGIGAPVIHIEKTADASQVNAGDDIGFRMTLWNTGNGDAKGATLTDPLPQNPGTSWSVDAAGAGFADGADCSIAPVAGVPTLTCGPETVPAGGTSSDKSTSTFWVHITSHTNASTGGDCVETSGVVDNTGHVSTTNDGSDQSEATVCVALPVIHIEKTADASQVNAGDDIGFRMTLWNTGNGDAKGATLTDPLPQNPGTSWSVDAAGAGFADGADCSIAPVAGVPTLTCGPETVPAGGTSSDKSTSTFWVHITSHTNASTGGDCVETSGVVDNTGHVSTTNDGSDQSEATVCVALPVIHIEKTADASQVNAGDDIGFRMTLWNTGNGDAKGATLTDPLPQNPGTSWSVDAAGAGFADGADCSIAPVAGVPTLTCGPETVPAGGTSSDKSTSTFWVHITSHTNASTGGDCVETSGVVDNTGHVSTTNDGSDQSEATVCVALPVIHIEKTADASQVNAGDDDRLPDDAVEHG